MVSLAAVLGMALVALGMVLTPGPNMIYLVSRSISQGWRAGLISLGGTAVGFLTCMTIANLGLAAVFVLVPWLYVALKAVGAVTCSTWPGRPSSPAAPPCSRPPCRETPGGSCFGWGW